MTLVDNRTVSELRERSFYPFFVWALLVVGLALNALILCGYLGLERLDYLSEFFDEQSGETIALALVLAAAVELILTFIVYAASLNPFRAARPSIHVYLNFIPIFSFAAAAIVMLRHGSGDLPEALEAALEISIMFAGPLLVVVAEVMLARVLLRLGRACDERGWSGSAFFFLKQSLRWRPSVHETARRCGLLLAEMGLYPRAAVLLERVGPIETSEDDEVLEALKRAYESQRKSERVLAVLGRQRELRPQSLPLARRYLDYCVSLERWDDAIVVLEAGQIELTTERLAQLQEMHRRTNSFSRAFDLARQVAELESPRFTRSVRLFEAMAEEYPDSIEVMTEFGRLLLGTGEGALLERGAQLWERVLEAEPERAEVRQELAAYYKETIQHERAQAHYERLIDGDDIEPATFLRLAEIFVSERREDQALELYRRLQAAHPEDWRGYHEEAAALVRRGAYSETEDLLAEAQRLAPDEAAKAAVEDLRDDVVRILRERELRVISDEINRDGADSAKRFEYIRQLLEADHAEKAIAECDELIAEKPERVARVREALAEALPGVKRSYRILDYLADLDLRQGNYDQVLETFERMAGLSLHPDKVLEDGCRKILAQRPEHWKARMKLVGLHRARGDWPGVSADLKSVLAEAPDEHARECRRNWVESLFRTDRVSEAADGALENMSLLEDDPDFQALAVEILQAHGDYQTAYTIHRAALKAFPDHEILAGMKTDVLEAQMRDRFKSLEDLRADGELTAPEHIELADLHLAEGRTKEAITHYQRAAEAPELRDIATTKMAVCLCERRLFKLADETLDPIELTKEKLASHRELKKLFYEVADTLDYEKYPDGAQKYFKRIFHVDASYRDVVSRLERLGGD